MLIDFDLFPQILPGLRVSRAISSSKNIAVQLATILGENDSRDVARVIFDKKFGKDIRESVKFLLDLFNLNIDNLIGLKKEYERIMGSSNKILNDEGIMDFGVVVGKSFGKFLKFANSPPVISARDLIAGGMRPGPEIGRALEDAEIKAYFESSDNISEANFSFLKRLVKISNELDEKRLLKEADYADNIILKYIKSIGLQR